MGGFAFNKKLFINAVNQAKREGKGMARVADILMKSVSGCYKAYTPWAGTPGMAKLDVVKYRPRHKTPA